MKNKNGLIWGIALIAIFLLSQDLLNGKENQPFLDSPIG